MEAYQLQYFLAIAKEGSFTKASEALYVSQPSLSAGIKKLEQELGVFLLERRWRGIVLTAAGELFLKKAEVILLEHHAAINALRNFQERPVLHIGLLCTLQIHVIIKIVQSFRELYPEVTVRVSDTHFDELDKWLLRGDVDIAVTNVTDVANLDSTHVLFQQRLLLAVPNSHLFSQKRAVELSELENEPFIERIKCEVINKKNPPIFEAAGVKPYTVYQADREEWVIALVQSGIGLTIMPEWENLDGITYVPLKDMQPVRKIGLQWNKKQNFKLTNLFRSFVAEGIWFDKGILGHARHG